MDYNMIDKNVIRLIPIKNKLLKYKSIIEKKSVTFK